MKAKYSLLFFLVFLTGCSNPISSNESIEKGLKFIDSSYSNYRYSDPYLEYVYPGENLNCYLENCSLTYRIVDGYFNVYFIENELKDYSTINNQIQDAHNVFDAIMNDWRKGEIYNAKKSTEEGFALDTYCIFSYVTKDEQMNEVILRYLDEDEWGIKKETIGSDSWREIADETWCIRALINTEDKELIEKLIDKQIDETNKFLSIHNDWDNSGVLYHILYVIYDYKNKFNSDKYETIETEYSNKLAVITQKDKNLLTNINSLDILSKINYENKSLLNNLASSVISQQKKDGHWDMAEEKTAPVFVTFRAIIALNSYKNEIE